MNRCTLLSAVTLVALAGLTTTVHADDWNEMAPGEMWSLFGEHWLAGSPDIGQEVGV